MTSLFRTKEIQTQKVVLIKIDNLIPNKSQPRTVFDDDALCSLARSIKENGIIQPICVRKSGVYYEIISGERRTRAAKIAGLHEVPCIVMDVDTEQSAVLAIIENIQRRDLSYFEEALAIDKLITIFGLTQESAAKRLGKAQSTIANKLRLLRFSDSERNLLITGNISERQARSLLSINDQVLREKTLVYVVTHHLNQQQTDELVEKTLSDVGENTKCKKTRKLNFSLPIPRLYINSINSIVKRMKQANISCETITRNVDGFFEYTIRVPVSADLQAAEIV